MTELTDEQKQDIYMSFEDAVSLAPKELEEWLQTEQSESVGDAEENEESTGHASGRRIVDIRRKRKAELSDGDYQHMRKVVGYIRRHTAQRPAGDVRDTRWRYSLMNWGHDPLK